MEEEGEVYGGGIPRDSRPKPKRARDTDEEEPSIQPGASLDDFVRALMHERQTILGDSKLSPKDKVRLLNTGRYPLSIATGRGVLFKTEQVVYAILGFSLVVIVILALLTAYSGLPQEVTVAFVGTVVGGTTATIAQKLGKV